MKSLKEQIAELRATGYKALPAQNNWLEVSPRLATETILKVVSSF